MRSYCHIPSPLGPLTATEEDGRLTGLDFGAFAPDGADERATPLFADAERQLNEYFDGQRSFFNLPLAPKGTPFQRAVWDALLKIPYGRTRTYRDIAEQIGHPNAVRAVGMANHRNPIAILIPCHRVIGASGHLTGYGGGLDKKEYLLNMEHVCAQLDK